MNSLQLRLLLDYGAEGPLGEPWLQSIRQRLSPGTSAERRQVDFVYTANRDIVGDGGHTMTMLATVKASMTTTQRMPKASTTRRALSRTRASRVGWDTRANLTGTPPPRHPGNAPGRGGRVRGE